jgi:ribosomal-protein-alanine N-acetyltransferase
MACQIKTPRLLLRPITTADLDELHSVWTDPEVRRYIWDGVAITREDAATIIARSIDYFAKLGYGLWAVIPVGEDRIVGFCGLWHFREPPELELIYGFVPAYWGSGLATEATRALIQYCFDELSLESIVGSTDAANGRSTLVMERAGMTLIKRATVGGLDTIFYEISRSQFEQAR